MWAIFSQIHLVTLLPAQFNLVAYVCIADYHFAISPIS
jgi:hypothetical protein